VLADLRSTFDRQYAFIGGGLLLLSYLILYFSLRRVAWIERRSGEFSDKAAQIGHDASGSGDATRQAMSTGAVHFRLQHTIPFNLTLIWISFTLGLVVILDATPLNLFIGVGILAVAAICSVWWLFDNKRLELRLIKLMQSDFSRALDE
jgi:hypothetical protein